MDPHDLKKLLLSFQSGNTSLDDAVERLSQAPLEDLGYAVIDHQRALRTGIPEVIYGEGKTPEQILGIASAIQGRGANVLVTRIGSEAGELLSRELPGATYHPIARMVSTVDKNRPNKGKGKIAIVCAGTSDVPVAEEAAITAWALGNEVERIFDVGVAGLHRLLSRLDSLREARVLVVVAGMEGALPSVIGGLVKNPVIAVPTSVGYGANFNGLSALLGMLNTCASGVTVVNIDNGFGAGFSASIINTL